jgi:1,2-phenylacetyl-CoA epoxidase catalytic subunit
MKNLVEDMNKKGSKAASNLSLEMFNKVYDDTTLFHFFADDYQVINWVYNEY